MWRTKIFQILNNFGPKKSTTSTPPDLSQHIVETAIGGGQVQGVAGAGSVTIDTFNVYNADLQEELGRFRNGLVPPSMAKVPFQAPAPPDGFVERKSVIKTIKNILISSKENSQTLVVSAIQGLGGIGKTALASYLAHDSEVQRRYPDGVLWATLGQNPDIQLWLNGWIKALGDFEFQSNDIAVAASHLRSLLHNKRMLLCVDDVWNREHAKPFLSGDNRSTVIVTTRRREIAEEVGARLYELELMTDEEGIYLIQNRIRRQIFADEQDIVLKLIDAVGHLPLALELVAAQAARGVTWEHMHAALQRELARLEAIETPRRRRLGETRLEACFNLSIDWVRRIDVTTWQTFLFLGVFPEDTLFTPEMLANALDISAENSSDILAFLYDEALLMRATRTSADAGQNDHRSAYRLRDLLYDIARRQLTEDTPSGLGVSIRECHNRIINNYSSHCGGGGWAALPTDGYAHRHLIMHMEQAGRIDLIRGVLAENDITGKNSWYRANEKIGQTLYFSTTSNSRLVSFSKV